MNEQQLQTLLSQVAALVEQFDRRCETASRELQQLTQQIPRLVRGSADEQIRRIPAEVLGSVKSGIQQPVAAYQEHLHHSGESLQRASKELAVQLQRMELLHKQLVWKVAGITLVSLLFLLAGGALLSKHYYDEIRRNQISADLLKAYNQADVRLCGEQLYAKVDARGKYMPVQQR